eukprot:TRINITY_DN1641_c0_g1_i7.p1 TRINITY_DN1641_c0_g1~~TRINITY_DN1641_c0_g1_i7.p1  ORF type:complete len:157 (+),score=20.20 TRINITY_DN1641_c0_g1_i7:264-734(+)
MEYLEETRPEPSFFPKDPYLKAKCRIIAETVNASIQPLQNIGTMNYLESQYKIDRVAWARKWNIDGLTAIEKMLPETRGKYCIGDDITIADCALFPQAVTAFERWKIDSKDFPIVAEIVENLKKIPAFIDAMPQNQPDFEEGAQQTKLLILKEDPY